MSRVPGGLRATGRRRRASDELALHLGSLWPLAVAAAGGVAPADCTARQIQSRAADGARGNGRANTERLRAASERALDYRADFIIPKRADRWKGDEAAAAASSRDMLAARLRSPRSLPIGSLARSAIDGFVKQRGGASLCDWRWCECVPCV